MTEKLVFVKLLDRWFIDLPQFKNAIDIAECEMIAGTDLLLSKLASNKQVLQLIISSEEPEEYNCVLDKEDSMEFENEIDGRGNYTASIIDSDEIIFSTYVWFPPIIERLIHKYPSNLYLKYAD